MGRMHASCSVAASIQPVLPEFGNTSPAVSFSCLACAKTSPQHTRSPLAPIGGEARDAALRCPRAVQARNRGPLRARSFRPLHAGGDGAARRPYLEHTLNVYMRAKEREFPSPYGTTFSR